MAKKPDTSNFNYLIPGEATSNKDSITINRRKVAQVYLDIGIISRGLKDIQQSIREMESTLANILTQDLKDNEGVN